MVDTPWHNRLPYQSMKGLTIQRRDSVFFFLLIEIYYAWEGANFGKIIKKSLYMGLRGTLKFLKFKVAQNPTYIIFRNFAKSYVLLKFDNNWEKATRRFGHRKSFSLNVSSTSFVMCVNIFYPLQPFFPYSLLLFLFRFSI